MHPSLFRKSIALTLIGATFAFAHAQELQQGDALAIHESQGIRYVSGGIGIDDVQRMRALSPGFNLRLRFEDDSDGSSLSDVVFVMLNQRNERLLHLRTEGPLLYLKLPPGHYLFAMAYQDNVQQRQVTVGRAPQQLTIGFRVNNAPISAGPQRSSSDSNR